MNYLTMGQFGHWGRWGNQLFQYAFLRSYANYHELELQLPPWVGQELFGCNEPPVSVNLPPWMEEDIVHSFRQPIPPQSGELHDRDFRGYAQYHTSHLRRYRDLIRRWFAPLASVWNDRRLPDLRTRLYERGRTHIGIHLRRGDYGQLNFYITPTEWYLRKLEEIWDDYESPVLFVATESPQLVEEFARYDPVTVADLGCEFGPAMEHYAYLDAERQLGEPWRLDFYPDFYLLSQCDVILAPNSTFSFAAAMLNPALQKFYRSNLITGRFHEEDPWDAWPLQRDLVDDYPVPGTFLEMNPPFWEKRVKAQLHYTTRC